MNKLSSQTSPYLLQHAENPVHWYPWGEEALALAKQQNKPILLSIGYSACHWCHVMAHESFEDEQTASLMNKLFINIKVDREERPDLDKIYQSAHQMLTSRSGGWPLTMFLMPDDQMPFFGGTYFPNKPRHGMIAFTDLLKRVSHSFLTRQEDIQRQSQSLMDALGSIYSTTSTTATLSNAPLDQARLDLQQQFDAQHGGFGLAPKFPHTPFIERLMRHGFANPKKDKKAIEMASITLEKMASGGVNDQLGGGFYRYSTDDRWIIPHFEKMLYDNGSLLAEYAQASVAIDNPFFKKISHATACWVMREMQSPLNKGQGGYYSSVDADSQDTNGHSHEGLFYLWTPDEVRKHLNKQEYAVFSKRFGLHKKANFDGNWHLYIDTSLQALAKTFSQTESDIQALLDSAQQKLFTIRKQRIPPERDDKILTSWNALMIRGMAMASRYLNKPEYAESATQAIDFIHKALWKENRLLATYKDGKAHLNAYLDDYAFLLDALLELLQVRWRTQDLTFAIQLADALLEHFEDKDEGGFWFVAHDHEPLIQRPKTYTDDAIPNGNGVAAFALTRLGYLLSEPRYLDAAERTLNNAAAGIHQIPVAHCTLLKALEDYLKAPTTVIIRGEHKPLETLKNRFNQHYTPNQQRYFIPADEENLPPALQDKNPASVPIAYVCEGMRCLPPQTQVSTLLDELQMGNSITNQLG